MESLLNSIRNVYLPNGVDADIYLRAQYETTFGIYNHYGPDDPKVPWPLMAVSPKEDLSAPNFLKLRLDQFAEYQVHSIFGLSFDELMEYPRREFLQVLSAAKAHSAKMAANMGGLGSRMDNLEKSIQDAQKAAQKTAGNRNARPSSQAGRK